MSREGLPKARRRLTINDRTNDVSAERVMYAARRAIKSCERVRCDINTIVECDDLVCLVKRLNSNGSFVVDVMDKKER